MTSISTLASDCGPVPAGADAVELTGDGTLNSQAASFRVCAADRGEPGAGSDLFYLECTAGCSYDTTGAGSTGILAGGNVQVHGAASSGGGSGDSASTLILEPVLLEEGAAGAAQVLTVRAFDTDQQPLAGAAVSIDAFAADGGVQALQGVTGPAGTAVFTVALPAASVEYAATSGGAESNTVRAAID